MLDGVNQKLMLPKWLNEGEFCALSFCLFLKDKSFVEFIPALIFFSFVNRKVTKDYEFPVCPGLSYFLIFNKL